MACTGGRRWRSSGATWGCCSSDESFFQIRGMEATHSLTDGYHGLLLSCWDVDPVAASGLAVPFGTLELLCVHAEGVTTEVATKHASVARVGRPHVVSSTVVAVSAPFTLADEITELDFPMSGSRQRLKLV